MGISFNQLINKSAKMSIAFSGGDLNVTYDPTKLSVAHAQKIQESVSEDDPMGSAIYFCEIVTDWDLLGPLGDIADKEPVPLEPEAVAWLPVSTMRTILEEIGDHSAPKLKRPRK